MVLGPETRKVESDVTDYLYGQNQHSGVNRHFGDLGASIADYSARNPTQFYMSDEDVPWIERLSRRSPDPGQ